MRYFARRVGFYLFTLWAAITINFFIPRMIPGDPVSALISQRQGQIDPGTVHTLNVLFGLDKHQSLPSQYWSYLGQLVHGDLGISFSDFPTPVTKEISSTLPWTLVLIGTTTIVAFAVGTLLGVLAGWWRGTLADTLLPVSSFLSSIPYFWLALLAVAYFGGSRNLLPTSGGYTPGNVPGFNGNFIVDAFEHSLLPALTIIISSVGGWLLAMRNMMVTVTAEDYITVAHAKGLSGRRVMLNYAARNALLPSISGFGMALGLVVGGAFLVESVFSYPGIGLKLINAIGQHDYPVIQGIFLVVTIAVLVANFLADLAYMLLDPRTRKEG